MAIRERLAPFAQYAVSLRDPETDDAVVLRVDRRTPYGNPYKMHGESESERERVVTEFWNRLALMDDVKLERLLVPIREHLRRGGVLACWCAPKLCHAQVWAAFATGAAD